MIKTRFPPEPNGHLHLGHAKSMFFNFNYPAKHGGGTCNLRFDDTNPKTETQEYADNILKDVKWLGYKSDKISYTSDYFDKILELTWELINNGYAYCDPSSAGEIKIQRRTKTESPYRNRFIKDTKMIFQSMIDGLYKEGEMALRLKIPINERTNDCMIDPIAYRIINTPHYRTGYRFNIYPSYEYSHYIVDSLEGITHSFCTLEFYNRRNLSYWILDKLKLPKLIIDETNRLETDFGLLSKRKVKALIDSKEINDWDDPRLLTISGLRNRGLSPTIINNFCQELGYTKHSNAITKEAVLDSCIRNHLNIEAPRRMAVFNPLKVILRNRYYIEMFNKPLYPQKENSTQVITPLGPIVYIEKDDFRIEANKKYKRLTPKNIVRLKYGGIIKYVSHSLDNDGNVNEVVVDFLSENENTEKVSGTIHWVSYQRDPIIVKLHRWNYPNSSNPIGQYNSQDIYIDNLLNEDYSNYWQLERVGYIYMEPGSTNPIHLTSLKEDPIAKRLKEPKKETKKEKVKLKID